MGPDQVLADMSDPETPENPPEEDINVVSDARDDIKVRRNGLRDAKGRHIKGSKALPGAGRPVECAIKARKTIQNIKAWTIIGEIGKGERIANPGQMEALKFLYDRGYGKVMDMQTHVHLMAGAAPEEKSGLRALSASELTVLARALTLPPGTAPTQPLTSPKDEDVVEGEIIEGEIIEAPAGE